ncbi:LPS export ABC transporter periplasmic protein LptC [Acinetobacter sp. MD2(2019)]|uniref:LPS export ABC transporter periplasmic protein LptC n=1 Tax=Acinetobacter sp. MD2(2019) TaxID=2605273 RepID=UPI002D1E88C2|nr:LPS export ABC transporter periplasmic protein LptC [Acinetobacter sp. MD2(2019)]MEB3754375.1 LPS export ABC transporter periplasmic protein LptC [Acinetobacter sp. MD2(2019)]
MDTRSLYIVALVVATVSGGYYYYSGKSKRLDNNPTQNLTYAAKEIKMTQTDVHGHLSARASADEMSQNKLNNASELSNFKAVTYNQGQQDADYYASKAQGFNNNEKIVLSGQVISHRNTSQGIMTLTTDQLTGYPKTKQIETNHVVNVDSPQSQFISQGLKADLITGQYEFFNIRGKYVPKS